MSEHAVILMTHTMRVGTVVQKIFFIASPSPQQHADSKQQTANQKISTQRTDTMQLSKYHHIAG
jgi:hypothetical protein